MRKILFLIAFFLSFKSNAEKVSFIIKNSTDTAQTISVLYYDPSFGNGTRQIWSGIIQKGESISTVKKDIEKNSTVYIYGLIKGTRKKLNQYIIAKKMIDENFTITKDMFTVNEISLFNFTNSIKIIEYDTSLFLEPKDISPKHISALFNQYLGGLIVYTENVENGKVKRTLLDRVDPIELRTAMKIYPRGTVQQTEKFYFTSDQSININGAFPGIAKGGFNFNGTSLYEMNVTYEGCGVISWGKENEVSLSDAFLTNVSLNTHYKLARLKEKYPNLKIKLIDKAYVLNSIFYQVNEHTKSSSEAEIGISTLMTSKGSYNSEISKSKNIIIGSSFLGYWCSESSTDVTSNLELSKGAAMSYILNIISAIPSSELALQEYKKYRVDFPSLPDLQTIQQIQLFLSLRINEVNQKEAFKGNKSLMIKTADSVFMANKNIDDLYNNFIFNNPDLKLPMNIDDVIKQKIIKNIPLKGDM